MGAVVGDGGGALGSAAFEEIDADALAAAQDFRRIDAEAAQSLDAGLGDVVLRQARDEGGLLAEERERNGDIGLAAAEGHFEDGGLVQAEIARRGQAQHDFSKGDDFHLIYNILSRVGLKSSSFARLRHDPTRR